MEYSLKLDFYWRHSWPTVLRGLPLGGAVGLGFKRTEHGHQLDYIPSLGLGDIGLN